MTEEDVSVKTCRYQRPVPEQKESNESRTAEWRLDPQRKVGFVWSEYIRECGEL